MGANVVFRFPSVIHDCECKQAHTDTDFAPLNVFSLSVEFQGGFEEIPEQILHHDAQTKGEGFGKRGSPSLLDSGSICWTSEMKIPDFFGFRLTCNKLLGFYKVLQGLLLYLQTISSSYFTTLYLFYLLTLLLHNKHHPMFEEELKNSPRKG